MVKNAWRTIALHARGQVAANEAKWHQVANIRFNKSI